MITTDDTLIIGDWYLIARYKPAQGTFAARYSGGRGNELDWPTFEHVLDHGTPLQTVVAKSRIVGRLVLT